MANSTFNYDAISESQAGKATTANQFFDPASQALLYGRRGSQSSGLNWFYYGGNVVLSSGAMAQIANGSVTLTTNTTNYVVANKATGAVSTSTTTTNWLNLANYWRLYSVVTNSSALVASYTDSRELGKFCGEFSYSYIAQNIQIVDYTLVLADWSKMIFHPTADTTARTFTIPANATVAFPIGTELKFVNGNLAGALTIAITTDTMRWANDGSVGSRTLAANGIARVLKVTATEWIISGFGLT